MKTKDELLTSISSLSVGELRTLNRYYLHPNNQRACNTCHQVFDGIREHFPIKKYQDNGNISWNVKCKTCFNAINRERRIEYRKDAETFIRSKLASYRNRAKQENIPFNLTADYLIDLWNNQKGLCHYIGEPIDFTLTVPAGTHPHLATPSLDKLTPSKGYVIGNVVWCSYGINRMKNDLDYDMFIKACELILKNRNI